MDYEEILTPVALYRDRLKAEHAENSAAAFEELLKRSGVDEAANAELVKVIRKLEKEVSELGSKLKWWKIFRGLMILVAVAGTLSGVAHTFSTFTNELWSCHSPIAGCACKARNPKQKTKSDNRFITLSVTDTF